MRTTLLLATLIGCDPGTVGPPPVAIDPPVFDESTRVGTLPDFYGSVPKNLLMISVDTFRRDHIDRYGDKQLTPNLSALADAGFALDSHTQCSNWTFASVTCTLRGAYNVENGFIPRLSKATRMPLHNDADFFAEWMSDAGFNTVLHSGNSWFGGRWNNTQGYQTVVQGNKSNALNLYLAGAVEMQDQIRMGDGEPWFLHVHLMEPHAPYAPPLKYMEETLSLAPVQWDLSDKDEQYEAIGEWGPMPQEQRDLLEQHLRIRYEGEIKYWDDQLKQIMADAGSRGLLDDTLVVIWNDHGEAFWEHNRQTHAYTLTREENDAFAIFWARNIVPGSYADPTVSIDLVPTLLQLWDIDIPPEVTGLPVGERDPDGPRYATSVARLGAVQSVRAGDWKMIFNWSGSAAVYNIAEDPGEQTNLYDPNDAKTQELWALLLPYVLQAEPLVNEYPLMIPQALGE